MSLSAFFSKHHPIVTGIASAGFMIGSGVSIAAALSNFDYEAHQSEDMKQFARLFAEIFSQLTNAVTQTTVVTLGFTCIGLAIENLINTFPHRNEEHQQRFTAP